MSGSLRVKGTPQSFYQLNQETRGVLGGSEVKCCSGTRSFQAWKALFGYQAVKQHTIQRLGWN